MMAITVNHDIAYPTSYGTLCNSHGPVGEIENELQLYDVQIQIAREKAEGYFIVWKGERIDIDCNGELSKWPNGFCDQSQHALVELLHVRGYGAEISLSDTDWRNNK